MDDPNKICERIATLVDTANRAREEAEAIYQNAVADGEDAELLAAVAQLLE